MALLLPSTEFSNGAQDGTLVTADSDWSICLPGLRCFQTERASRCHTLLAYRKGLGQDVSHLTLAEREPLNQFNQRYGLGNLNQSVWLFGILAVGCAVATFFAFIQ